MNQKQMTTLASVIQSRNALGYMLGKSYGTDRDLYAALGYPKNPTFDQYENKFRRQDIAKRVINAFPESTWRGKPNIFETDEDTDTAFEKSLKEAMSRIDFYQYFLRVDKLAGIAQYAILFVGFNDGDNLDQPVNNATEVLYTQPYSQKNAPINSYESDTKNERYGLPKDYKLNLGSAEEGDGSITSANTEQIVHWSRVIHVAEGLTESNILGTPRLECIYNRLENLELILGADAEAWWRNAYPGLSLEQEPGTTIEDTDDLEDEIDEYIHNMRRVIKLKGMKANVLSPSIADPEKHVDVQIKMIAGATKIPQRILTGSERGELASSQDKENFDNAVAERRIDFAEPMILRAFIDRLVEAGVIDAPGEEGYFVVWPDIESLSDKDQADIGKLRAETLKAYLDAGGDMLIPPLRFLVDVMGYEEDEAKVMLKDIEKRIDEEEKQVLDGVVDPNEEPISTMTRTKTSNELYL